MTKIIVPSGAAGALTILNAALGRELLASGITVGNLTTASGNGFLANLFSYWYLFGVENPSAADSRHTNNPQTENWATAGNPGQPWGQKWALSFFLRHLSMQKQGTLAIGFGQVPNTAAPHTTWRTDTTFKRAQLVIERSAGGVITWFLVCCTGAATTARIITPLATGDPTQFPNVFITLIFNPGESLEIYADGALYDSAIVSLPSGSSNILCGLGAWQTPVAGAPGNYMRMLAPSVFPVFD